MQQNRTQTSPSVLGPPLSAALPTWSVRAGKKARLAFRSVFGSLLSRIGPNVAPLSSFLNSLLLFRHELLANAKNTPHSVLVRAVLAPPPASESLPAPLSSLSRPRTLARPSPPGPAPSAPRHTQERSGNLCCPPKGTVTPHSFTSRLTPSVPPSGTSSALRSRAPHD